MAVRVVSGAGQAAGGVPVYIQADEPDSDVAALWVPLNNDQTPKTIAEAQVFVPEFNPGVALSSLYAWYSAPAINDKATGDPVGQWSDLSGNARHLTQPTPAKQPIYIANVQNGQPVLRFTESALTSLIKTGLSKAQPFEIFAVFRVRTDVNPSKTNILDGGGGAGIDWNLDTNGGQRAIEIAFTTNRGTSNTTVPLSWNAYRFVVDAANSRVFVTAADSSLFGPSSPGTAGLTQLEIGSTSGKATDIDWGELIVTGGLLSAEERAAVGAHLTGVWGTA